MPTTSTTPDRAIKRERERRARQRRVARIRNLQLTNDALECAVVVARTLGDDVSVWSDFLDERTTRFRYVLLRSLQLTNEINTLRIEQAQLRRLLQEHQIWVQTAQGLMNDRPTHDWEALGEHWRRLIREHYRPWTREQCQDEIADAMKEIYAFQWTTDKQTTGMTINGWREVRRIDPGKRVLQFEFTKTFHGFDVMDYVNMAWDAYTDAASFREIVGGNRMLVHLELLQQIGPNTTIVRLADRHRGVPGDAHGIYLVFRMRTDRGFMQCVRAIWCPEVVKAIQGPNDSFALSNFFWFHWDMEEGGDRAFTFRNGGTIGSVDVSYASRWMTEVFAVVLRGEHRATGRNFLIATEPTQQPGHTA